MKASRAWRQGSAEARKISRPAPGRGSACQNVMQVTYQLYLYDNKLVFCICQRMIGFDGHALGQSCLTYLRGSRTTKIGTLSWWRTGLMVSPKIKSPSRPWP